LEHRVDWEVGLRVGDRGVYPGAVFEEEEVSEERRLVTAEPAFPVGGPDVFGVAYGFLGAVVEVVPEAGPDLGLELHSDEELAVVDDEEVPFLFRPVVPGQLQRGT